MLLRQHFKVAVFCIGAAIVSAAYAQGPIKVKIGTGTPVGFPDNQPIVINVGTVSTELEVRIYDEDSLDVISGVPTRNIPAVTVNGIANGGRLSIVVGDGDHGFPTSPDFPANRGAIDFAGLIVGNDDLRGITRIAVEVAGDITGTIDVGHVFRIHASGRVVSGTFTGGRILGDIISRAAEDSPVTVSSFDPTFHYGSIQFIHAGDLIEGDVLAGWDPSLGTAVAPADIANIRVGNINNIDPNTFERAAAGIMGDIRADKGHIGTIYTEGPIGALGDERLIYAGSGIDEIRVIPQDQGGGHDTAVLLNRDINAHIQANLAMLEPNYEFQGPSGAIGASADGSIRVLDTAGDLNGEVTVANLIYTSGDFDRHGIWVQGEINADIDIAFNMNLTNIVAGRINGSITIGRTAKGCIAAVGRSDDPATPGVDETLAGRIEFVEIGYRTLNDDPANSATDEAALYGVYTPGLAGTDCAPYIDTLDPTDWFDPFLVAGCDAAAVDGAIRAAHSIGTVRMRMMTQRYAASPVPLPGKSYVPRIEAPVIDTLDIDDMREGVVWSGRLERDASYNVITPENDYAVIGVTTVGCMGPASDIWVTDTALDVGGIVMGEIHVDKLGSGDLIRIGGALAAWPIAIADPDQVSDPEALACGDQYYYVDGDGGEYDVSFYEESPRDATWDEELSRERGAIRVLECNGLAGQIIINANSDIELLLGEGWDGQVIIGDHLPSQTPPANAHTLDPAGAQPDDAPYYKRLPTDPTPTESLGGGAVGLVPFNMHGLASNPPYDGVTPPERLVSAFNRTSIDILSHFDIDIEHYGPILATDGSVIVEFDENGTWTRLPSSVVTVETWLQNPTLGRRTLRIKGQGANMAGLFRFRPDTVFNADTLSSGPSLVYPWEYRIKLLPDCDEDGVADGDDPDTSSCTGGCCDLDSNNLVDVFDLLAYLDRWFQSAPQAEWDGVSGINVFDLLGFLDCWFQQGAGACGP